MKFFLQTVADELNKELDLRAKGHGKNIFKRIGIYTAAMVRDIIRIPLHHRAGIGQARFRARVEYISANVIPTLKFFQKEYPIDKKQHVFIDEAIELLRKGVSLISDGPFPKLDEWYATIEEFYELTVFSEKAAEKIEKLIAE